MAVSTQLTFAFFSQEQMPSLVHLMIQDLSFLWLEATPNRLAWTLEVTWRTSFSAKCKNMCSVFLQHQSHHFHIFKHTNCTMLKSLPSMVFVQKLNSIAM